jgi:hypothetical protein
MSAPDPNEKCVCGHPRWQHQCGACPEDRCHAWDGATESFIGKECVCRVFLSAISKEIR